MFSKKRKEVETSSDNNNEYASPLKKSKNQETFAYATPINEIPSERRLSLDGY